MMSKIQHVLRLFTVQSACECHEMVKAPRHITTSAQTTMNIMVIACIAMTTFRMFLHFDQHQMGKKPAYHCNVHEHM